MYLADVEGPQIISVLKHTGKLFVPDFDEVRTVSIDTPRKNHTFYGGKVYLFDDANGSARDVSCLNFNSQVLVLNLLVMP